MFSGIDAIPKKPSFDGSFAGEGPASVRVYFEMSFGTSGLCDQTDELLTVDTAGLYRWFVSTHLKKYDFLRMHGGRGRPRRELTGEVGHILRMPIASKSKRPKGL